MRVWGWHQLFCMQSLGEKIDQERKPHWTKPNTKTRDKTSKRKLMQCWILYHTCTVKEDPFERIGKFHRNHLVIYVSKTRTNYQAVLSHAAPVSTALSESEQKSSDFRVPRTCRKTWRWKERKKIVALRGTFSLLDIRTANYLMSGYSAS